MKDSKLLLVAVALICFALLKPNLGNIIPFPSPVGEVTVSEPTDANLKKEADEVVKLLRDKVGASDRVKISKLRDLYVDMARLVQLDGENEVIKTTEEIKQANGIAGVMLDLDLKNKYSGLSKETNDVVVAAIGEDAVALSTTLRPKASDGFMALAWAYNEGLK